MKSEPNRPSVDADSESVGRSSTAFVAAFIAVMAVVVAYFALGMPGMDHSP